MPVIVGLFREAEFSPGKREDDAAILERTAAALAGRGYEIELGAPDAALRADARAILAMCQSPAALAALDLHAPGIPVINAPGAIRNCYRTETVRLLAAAGVSFPRTRIVTSDNADSDAAAPCWVKRGDVHATAAGDVVFAPDAAALAAALADFAARGVARVALQDHVEGPVVKFYGLADGSFFRCYSDTACPPAALPALWAAARAGAAALGLEIFGGDLVVTAGGTPVLIDVNDWPSFGRCRDEAAEAIAAYVHRRLAASAAGIATGRPTHAQETRTHAR